MDVPARKIASLFEAAKPNRRPPGELPGYFRRKWGIKSKPQIERARFGSDFP